MPYADSEILGHQSAQETSIHHSFGMGPPNDPGPCRPLADKPPAPFPPPVQAASRLKPRQGQKEPQGQGNFLPKKGRRDGKEESKAQASPRVQTAPRGALAVKLDGHSQDPQEPAKRPSKTRSGLPPHPSTACAGGGGGSPWPPCIGKKASGIVTGHRLQTADPTDRMGLGNSHPLARVRRTRSPTPPPAEPRRIVGPKQGSN